MHICNSHLGMEMKQSCLVNLGVLIELLCWRTTPTIGLFLSHSKFKVIAIQLNLNEKAIVSDFTYELGYENHFTDQSQAT